MICPVLEETALVRGKEKQTFVTIKGVPQNYNEAVNADSVIEAGKFKLEDENGIYTILGAALFNQIDASVGYDNPVSFYAPKYATKVNIANPNQSFNTQYAYISGIYATHQMEIDSKYAFLPLQYAQEMFNYNGLVSALEIKIKGDNVESAKTAIQNALGEGYVIQDKMEQHQDFYKMMKIEKWITFLILFFILMIAVVNIIGSLTMLILEKGKDIQTLKHLGATPSFIQQVFLLEGWLISALGTIVGLAIGLVLCLIQEYFGIIKLGNGSDDGTFFIQAYPVYVQWTDILIILTTTLFAGLITAWIPTRYIKKKEK
jgi:ABC-type lipoprotein release transport system permease subunit